MLLMELVRTTGALAAIVMIMMGSAWLKSYLKNHIS